MFGARVAYAPDTPQYPKWLGVGRQVAACPGHTAPPNLAELSAAIAPVGTRRAVADDQINTAQDAETMHD
eukprot:COSAG05_NODE_10184_length_579_cov_0.637500_1_plen_70_part_00